MGMFSDDLAVEWTQYGRASGLLRALVALPAAGTPATVRVTVDGTEVYAAAATPKPDGRVHLNLHTHLLEDGRHTIRLQLNRDGRAWSATAHYEIRNAGGVAGYSAAHHLRSAPDPRRRLQAWQRSTSPTKRSAS